MPGFVPGGGDYPAHLRRWDVIDTAKRTKIGQVKQEHPGNFLVEATNATGAGTGWSERYGSREAAREALERHLFG